MAGATPEAAAAPKPFVLSSSDEEHHSINLRLGTTVLCRHRSVAATFGKKETDPTVCYIGLSDCGIDNNHLQYLSRKHVKITCRADGNHTVCALTTKQPELEIVRLRGQPLVLNEPTPIGIGDELVLLGDAIRHDLNELKYRFQPTSVDLSSTASDEATQSPHALEISDDEPSTAAAAAEAEAATQAAVAKALAAERERAQERNMERWECNICNEIQLEPTCCVPCGHSFCASCLKDWREREQNQPCPTCSQAITETCLSYQSKSQVEDMIEKGEFPPAEAETFKGRKRELEESRASGSASSSTVAAPKPAATASMAAAAPPPPPPPPSRTYGIFAPRGSTARGGRSGGGGLSSGGAVIDLS